MSVQALYVAKWIFLMACFAGICFEMFKRSGL